MRPAAAPVLQLRVPEDSLAPTRPAATTPAPHGSCGSSTANSPARIPRRPRPAETTLTTSPPLAALADGEPSPGVLCMTPGCFQLDTRKYGLRKLALCTACAATLTGEVYQRPVTAVQARAVTTRPRCSRSSPRTVSLPLTWSSLLYECHEL
jgi:hypothetical protein